MKHRNGFLIGIALLTTVVCKIQIGPTPPPAPCPIESLLLEEFFFHPDIHQTGPPSKKGAPMRFGVDKIGVGFTSMTQGGAVQDVYQGRDMRQTQKQFVDFVESEFLTREGWTEWYIPNSLNYQSTVADQFRFGCYRHKASSVETCQFIGQYDVYLVRFHADMSSILTYQDLYGMLQAIDSKIAQCLSD